MKRFLILVCTMLLAGATFPSGASAEINIGVVGPMKGQYAAFGRQMRRGVEMAVKEINAAGGINGEKLAVIVGDDRCDATKAVEAADKMVAKKTLLVVGHFCSAASIDASHIYAQEKIVQISPASSNPVFTEQRPGPGIFRVVPSDSKQGAFAGAYIAARFASKKVALLDDNTVFGTYLTRWASASLDAAGQSPALREHYVSGLKDYSALISKLKAAGIEVVYAGGYHDDIGRLVREMRKQGMTAHLIASDALATSLYWRIAGRASEGTLMSFIADPRKNAAAVKIVKKFRAAKIEPDGYTLHNYVAVKLWADAAKAAGSTSFDGVVAELNKVSMETAIGKVRFDKNGDLVEPQLIWYVWRKGKYVPLKSATSGN
jgi:branched-chain amino acid transport system substrate-binding protein